MPAIWNSYSKSETARRPRMITLAPTDSAKCISSVSKARTSMRFGVAVFEMGDLVAHDLDPLVGREERPLAVIAGDADHQPVDELGRAQDDVGMAVGDRVEGAGIDPDARLGSCVPRIGLLAFGRSVRLSRRRPRLRCLAVLPGASGSRATETTRSPSPTLKITTPWLRRRAMRISSTGQRITIPPLVTSMIWSLLPDREHGDDGIARGGADPYCRCPARRAR